MVCQTRELEQILKNMTWTCLLQLLSQGNSASTCQGSFLRCFYFVFYWLEALGQGNSADTCQGSFLCCSALTIRDTIQVRSSLLVLMSYKIEKRE